MNNKLKSSQQAKNLKTLGNLAIGGIVMLAIVWFFPSKKPEVVSPSRAPKVWIKRKPVQKSFEREILDVDYSIEQLKLEDKLLEIQNSNTNRIDKKKSLRLLKKKDQILKDMEDIQLRINLRGGSPKFDSTVYQTMVKNLKRDFEKFESDHPTLIIKQ